MVEHIDTTSTMQANTIQSVKSAEGAKTREAKESTAEQAGETRKRDRFEYSGEASYVAGSPDDPKAREAFDKKQSAEQTNDPRSCDRLELSGKYLSSSQSVSDASSESVDTNELYRYTDTELKDFLLDGSITKNEYDAEIAKRAD